MENNDIIDDLLVDLKTLVDHDYFRRICHMFRNDRRLILKNLLTILNVPIDDPSVICRIELLLKNEMKNMIITNSSHIKRTSSLKFSSGINTHICVWRGDITKLSIDVIINAANSGMLGCFAMNHPCIDNAIHCAAGI